MSKIIIYSSSKIDGLEGFYRNPNFFTRVEKDATLVYTDNEYIKKAYKVLNVEVKPLTKQTKDALDEYLENNNLNKDEALEKIESAEIKVEYTPKGNLTKQTKDALDELFGAK